MSPARHMTHNPRHGLGSRLGWREISTGGTTLMPDSARAESGASGLASLHHSRLSTRLSYQLYSFSGDRRFCYDNHGSFVYDSPNLFCGPSGSVRTGLTGVWSEPGHRTHLTSLLSFIFFFFHAGRPARLTSRGRAPTRMTAPSRSTFAADQ